MTDNNREAMEGHWEKTRNLTFIVLALWFFFAFVVHWFANTLNAISFLGFPLGYYMAVQGSLAIFVVLIFFQNWQQDKIDDEFGVGENEEE
ncbi:MAG: DUF4212 domain-containing protein [Pseudomonadota bacterium]